MGTKARIEEVVEEVLNLRSWKTNLSVSVSQFGRVL